MKKYSHADKPAAAIKKVAIVIPVFIFYIPLVVLNNIDILANISIIIYCAYLSHIKIYIDILAI